MHTVFAMFDVFAILIRILSWQLVRELATQWWLGAVPLGLTAVRFAAALSVSRRMCNFDLWLQRASPSKKQHALASHRTVVSYDLGSTRAMSVHQTLTHA